MNQSINKSNLVDKPLNAKYYGFDQDYTEVQVNHKKSILSEFAQFLLKLLNFTAKPNHSL